MFNQEEFSKNQFIIRKIKHELLPPRKTCQKNNDLIHVAFNIDDNFFMQMGVTVTSILENNKEKSFCFHIFCDGVSDDNLEKVKQLAEKYQQNFYVYFMDMKPFQTFHIKTRHFSRVTYLRSVMPKILQPLTNKYLYMDADMLCVGDISEITSIDLEGYPFAAASETEEAVKYKTEFLHQKSGKHFNDGLMWIDIAEWEREQITEKIFSYQGADPNMFSGQSQDIMNLVLDGEIKFIDRRYNGGSDKGTLIYHFSGRNKPWHMVIGKRDRIWRHYLDISPWPGMPDPLPPKTPKHYYNYKLLMQLAWDKGNILDALKFMYWYSVLKVKLKFQAKQ